MTHSRLRFFGGKQAAILNAFYHLNNEQPVALLSKADLALVRYISESALNLLRVEKQLNNGHKARLCQHLKILRFKKKIVLQRGGSFLPALLTLLLDTILSNLVN